MPPLADQQLPVISAVSQVAPRWHPSHPSPLIDGLALEVRSAREIGYWGARFGIDTPYYAVPTGWGEWIPATDVIA